MSNKKTQKKHQPEEEQPKPFAFLDRVEWVWTGHEWQIKELGSWWWGNLTSRYYRFMHEIYSELGGCDGWCTINHAERMLFQCLKHPVFQIDPDPIFVRKWLDNWIELQYCRIWQHVFNTLRLKKGIDEFEAKQRADTLASQFEALYEPTWPRLPQVMKSRRGSKRAKMTDKSEIFEPSEPTTIAVDAADLDRSLELHGPHPSPLLSYECCYRVIDRTEPEPEKYDSRTRAGFWDGCRVVVLAAGNDPVMLKIAAETMFRELKRRRVNDRLQNAEIVTADVAPIGNTGSLYTIKSIQKPTLAEAAQALGLQESDLSAGFGVCLIDPEAGQYTVMVERNADKITPGAGDAQGPYSNPGIGTYGPVDM